MNGDPLSKRAQELSTDGIEPPPPPPPPPPPQFSVMDQSSNLSVPLAEIPMIDLCLLSAGSPGELTKLRSALSSWGYFQVMEYQVLFSMTCGNQMKQLFSLQMEENNKSGSLQLGENGSTEGYRNDHVYSDRQIVWCDRLILTLLPEDRRSLNLWPKSLSSFQEVVHEYSMEIKAMINFMLKAIARSLNLREESFITQFGDQPVMHGSFNFYPACPKPDKVLGARAHSDGSGITVILPGNDVPGLQVFKDEKWFAVPLVRDALVVNLGDQMQIMSNGILKSPLHRVTVNSEQERISIIAFYLPGEHTEIGPIEELISDTRPRLYQNLSNYRATKHELSSKWKNTD